MSEKQIDNRPLMNDEELTAAGVSPDLVRFSCGLESSADLIEDIEQALSKI